MAKQTLTLDLRAGGLGDNWMRLVAFYAAAALRPEYQLRLVVPATLVAVAQHTFTNRLEILATAPPEAVVYTVRGLRAHIISAALGQRYAAPYGRVVLNDAKRWNLKDRLNGWAFAICDQIRWVYSPPWFSLNHYQGFAEVVTIPTLRTITPPEFNLQLEQDAINIRALLQTAPRSPELRLPAGLEKKVVVFPSGTSRQFIPLEWARTHLPTAVFAFFHKDPDLELWRKAGLEVVAYYQQPGDMLALATAARASASTDSFPSHFLQSCAPRFVVMLTELARYRVVSPAFRGPVVPSLAPCHPCVHLERKGSPLCQAGHPACLNWQSATYADLITKALATASDGRDQSLSE